MSSPPPATAAAWHTEFEMIPIYRQQYIMFFKTEGTQSMNYIGLDIGGTKCAASLGKLNDGFEILEKTVFATADLSPAEVIERFCTFIDSHKAEPLGGIGISCGGPLDSKNGVVLSPPSLPKWDGIPIVSILRERYGVPTYLQNDANACAVAEWKYGAGRGTENMIFLTFGTGFGAGLILGGKLYAGINDNAGEIGHVRLTKDGPLGYFKNGSCEGYCSGSGIARLTCRMLHQKRYEGLARPLLAAVGGEQNITAKAVAELAKQGDPFCTAVYRKSGQMLGRTLSILIDVLNPQKIIIGGVYMRSEELLWCHAEKEMKKECLPDSLGAVRVEKAGLGEQVGDYAALAVAVGNF